MRIAICDDEKEILSDIDNYLLDFAATNDYSFDIAIFQSSAKFIDKIESGLHYDIVICDIIMPNFTGMTVAKDLRKYNNSTPIIFLTSSPEFALEAYDVEAIGYLLKPLDKDKFDKVLYKAIQKITTNPSDSLVLQSAGKLTTVSKKNIKYIEVQHDKLLYYLSDNTIVNVYGTINKLEHLLLNDISFIKPHRSYIVNMDYINQLDNKNIYIKGCSSVIPISRNNYLEIKKAYVSFMVSMAGKGGIL